MKVHVITAVSRPWNLAIIAQSLAAAARNAPDVDLTWHCRLDVDRQHVGGQWLKNMMLSEIGFRDGWVWILDDDTTVHPDLFRRVAEIVDSKSKLQAVIVSQRRVDGSILHAAPENMVLGGIDAGQAIVRRGFIDAPIPITYAGDGEWLELLLHGRRDVSYLDEVLSFHNLLSGVDDGPP